MAIAPCQRAKFAHRENRDGTFDSICCECFLTIAASESEVDLIGKSRLLLALRLASPSRLP
jgi:hypothetical protein